MSCLVALAVVLAWLAHHNLRQSERDLAEEQFQVLAHRAIVVAQEFSSSRWLGAVTMAKIASYAHPNASKWPFVYISAFETISRELIDLYGAMAQEFAFMPKVEPGGLEQEQFEDFALDYFHNIIEPPFPNITGYAGQPDPNVTDKFVKDLTKALVRGITAPTTAIYPTTTRWVPPCTGKQIMPCRFPVCSTTWGISVCFC